eukprot:712404-Rhodomonas_salina.2
MSYHTIGQYRTSHSSIRWVSTGHRIAQRGEKGGGGCLARMQHTLGRYRTSHSTRVGRQRSRLVPVAMGPRATARTVPAHVVATLSFRSTTKSLTFGTEMPAGESEMRSILSEVGGPCCTGAAPYTASVPEMA